MSPYTTTVCQVPQTRRQEKKLKSKAMPLYHWHGLAFQLLLLSPRLGHLANRRGVRGHVECTSANLGVGARAGLVDTQATVSGWVEDIRVDARGFRERGFSCRLVWGTWQTVVVYGDMWNALQQTWSAAAAPKAMPLYHWARLPVMLTLSRNQWILRNGLESS
jgi:hypothetical protein